jgi:ABC-type branched-subunit amino acid transport system permease subunit
MKQNQQTIWVIVALLIAAGIAPWVLPTYYLYLLNLILINIILALGLNVLTGNSGQISLCHSSFMAIGAYTYTLLNNHSQLPMLLCVLGAVLLASVGGILVGYPARRLSGIYLALATLAFLSLTQILIEEFPDLTGGIRGLKIEPSEFLGWSMGNETLLFYIVAIACGFCLYITANMMRSRIGRAFDAIRTSPHAAQALGIQVAQVKLVAFTISAAYAGLAGALFSMVVGFIDPVEFGVSASLRYITFIVVGGMGSIAGSVIGAVVFTALPEALRGIKEYGDLVYSAILLLSLIFMPNGLVGLLRARKSKPNASTGGH